MAAEHLFRDYRLRRALEAVIETKWHERLAWGWLGLGALAALWSHTALAIGAFGVNYFDEAGRLLQAVYAARDLTPYADYGFIYPPGYAWFYGKLLRLQEPELVRAAIAVVNLLLVVACAGQLMRLAKDWRPLYGGTVLLMLGGAIPIAAPNVQDPHSMILVPISVLLLVEVMTRGPSAARMATLVSVAAVTAVFRWDWILFVALLEAGAAAVVLLATRMMRLELGRSAQVQRLAARLWWAALATLAGVALAIALMAAYALAAGVWSDTRLFVFKLPLLITSLYHPSMRFMDSSPQWLMGIIAMSLIALAALLACVKARAKPGLVYLLEGGALLAPCVALLPYTFSSDDLPHFLPLSVLVIVTSLTALTLWPSLAARWLLLIAMGVVAKPTLSIALQRVVLSGVVPQADIHLQKTRELTAGCTDLFPLGARSLFLGQVSYNGHPGNYPILYLMRPDLRPATPFISDNLGVQSSCTFGSRIASDLILAPRPLVIVLDTKPWSTESNLTPERTSCGKIEAIMATMPAVELGSCQLAGRAYRVMVVH
jgi:hypothetical protein